VTFEPEPADLFPLWEPKMRTLTLVAPNPFETPEVNAIRAEINDALIEKGKAALRVIDGSVSIQRNGARWNFASICEGLHDDHDKSGASEYAWVNLPDYVMTLPGLTEKQKLRARLGGSCNWAWKLIEPQSREAEPSEEMKGMWRLTHYGYLFAERLLLIPKYMYTYEKRVLGFGPERLSFDQVKARTRKATREE